MTLTAAGFVSPPTVETIMKRYEERTHDYCYWSHAEVTVLIEALQARDAEVKKFRERQFGETGT